MIDRSVAILMIEDNPGDVRQVQEILYDVPGFACQLDHANRLSSGIDHLESNNTDIVLLDLNLPDSYGYETYQQLHQRFPNMPIIILTGLDDEQLGLRAVRDGAQDYLAKGNLEGNLLSRTIRYAIERKLAEIALHKSEQLFRKTFSCMNDALFIIDAQSMQIASCNPAAYEIFGYRNDELVGKNSLLLLGTGEDAGETIASMEAMESCQRGKIYEKLLRRKNGEAFFAEFSFEAIEDQPSQVQHWVVLLRDISLRKQAEETLRESEERYYLAARGANDGLWDWNIKKECIYYSPRWKDMLGYADGEIAPTIDEWIHRIHPDDREAVLYAISNHLNHYTHHFESEHRILHHDGSYRWMLVRGMAVRDANGIAYRMAGSQTDVTARKNAEEQLLHDAFHDLLTGLPNRALFLDRLERAIEYSRRYEKFGFAALFLDLDRFKVINDSLGHAVGDQLLVEISKALSTCLRTVDTVARFGGDEFVVLLDDITDVHDAIKVVKNIQDVLSRAFKIGNNRVFTSASIGIVLSSSEYTSTEDIMRDADIAMYQAKMLGTAHYVVFNTEMRNQAINRLSMENDLRHAVSRGELVLEYQPIVTLKEKSLAGFEALLRWTHPKKGNIPPEEFIPIAEETGLIIDLGHWVLRQACLQMHRWQEQFPGYRDLFINVNISQKQFAQPEFVQRMRRMLKETGLDPACLNLEITENVLMEDAEAMIAMLNRLRELGVGLHVDDFGKGFSSLSYLQQFPIDTLKIDYTFINRIGTNGDHLEIVKTILVLARELGVDTIAEGIETENQLAQLLELDCHYGQGFYLGRPMLPAKVTAYLKSRHKASLQIELGLLPADKELSLVQVNPNVLRVPAWRK